MRGLAYLCHPVGRAWHIPKGLPKLTPYPSFSLVSTGLPCHFFVLHSPHTQGFPVTCRLALHCSLIWSVLALVGLVRLPCLLVHASVNTLYFGKLSYCCRATGYLFGQLVQLSYRSGCLAIHYTLSACISRLLVLTNMVEASKRQNSFHCFTDFRNTHAARSTWPSYPRTQTSTGEVWVQG